jgi:hypothetical protein
MVGVFSQETGRQKQVISPLCTAYNNTFSLTNAIASEEARTNACRNDSPVRWNGAPERHTPCRERTLEPFESQGGL